MTSKRYGSQYSRQERSHAHTTQLDDVYQLLHYNYVEDDEAMFRFKYSASFLNW